jgi:hypothetical protein
MLTVVDGKRMKTKMSKKMKWLQEQTHIPESEMSDEDNEGLKPSRGCQAQARDLVPAQSQNKFEKNPRGLTKGMLSEHEWPPDLNESRKNQYSLRFH